MELNNLETVKKRIKNKIKYHHDISYISADEFIQIYKDNHNLQESVNVDYDDWDEYEDDPNPFNFYENLNKYMFITIDKYYVYILDAKKTMKREDWNPSKPFSKVILYNKYIYNGDTEPLTDEMRRQVYNNEILIYPLNTNESDGISYTELMAVYPEFNGIK